MIVMKGMSTERGGFGVCLLINLYGVCDVCLLWGVCFFSVYF